MDYDNDGIMDFISGSYDPGDVYLFRGLGDGKYAAVEKILDQNGLPLVHHPKEYAAWEAFDEEKQNSGDMESIELRVASFGSWPAAVDWDADGDLDLLIGSFGGDLFLRKNVGTRSKPEYDGKAIPVKAAGEPLHVNHHAAPVVADWNGDGKWDLVVGSSDGAVGWFPNHGKRKKPKFGEYRQLVPPKSESKFLMQYLQQGDDPKPGVRSQIFVTDYDLDGKLDLVVGDYSDLYLLRELSDEEKEAHAAVRAEIDEMMADSNQIREKYSAAYESGDYDDEAFQAEMKTISERYEKLEKRNKEFIKETRSASFVWLYQRRQVDKVETQPKKKPGKSGQAKSGRTKSEQAKSDEERPAKAKSGPTKSGQAKSDSVQPDLISTDQLSMVTSTEPVPGTANEFRVIVDVVISSGWHIYSDVPKDGAHQVATLKLQLPDGSKANGKWKRPDGAPSLESPREKIYTGVVQFSQTVKVDDPSKPVKFRVLLDYEVCKSDFCLPPSTLRQTVEWSGRAKRHE